MSESIRLKVDGLEVVVRRADVSEIIDLRHRILRAELPREEAMFAGDDLPSSGHFGAFLNDQAVCCATFHFDPYQQLPALRLRGMATDSNWQGKGLGHAVLTLAEASVWADFGIPQLWCNAREPAVRFYQDMGWTIVSERFDIPTAGPHFRMQKRATIVP